MNKLLPILLVITISSNISAENRSKAEEMLGKECINLNCALADEICGKRNESGIRKLDDGDCRMGIARYNMRMGNVSTEPDVIDPCVEIDCSIHSPLASQICIDSSSSSSEKLETDECKMRIKRFQRYVLNGETHEQAIKMLTRKENNYKYNRPYINEEKERRAIASYKYPHDEKSDAWYECMIRQTVDPIGKYMSGIQAGRYCDAITK